MRTVLLFGAAFIATGLVIGWVCALTRRVPRGLRRLGFVYYAWHKVSIWLFVALCASLALSIGVIAALRIVQGTASYFGMQIPLPDWRFLILVVWVGSFFVLCCTRLRPWLVEIVSEAMERLWKFTEDPEDYRRWMDSLPTPTESSFAGTGPAVQLTIERASAIVENAENEFASDSCIVDAFMPFARGGASNRREALNALYVVVADRFRFSSTRMPGSSGGMEMFDEYAFHSRGIAMRIMCDDVCDAVELKHVAISTGAAFDSFVTDLKTLNSEGGDFWPRVYQIIDLEYSSKEQTG